MKEVFMIAISLLYLYINKANALNYRPIIGVVAQETDAETKKYGDTFIRSTYVKFLEMGGARVVPIRTKMDDGYYEDLFKKLNGVFYPGGGVSIIDSGYALVGKKFFELATQANSNGDYFPMWGTCQGFQLLSALSTGKDLLVNCYGENISLPLEFEPDFRSSRIYKNLSDKMYEDLKSRPITQNNHHYCLTPKVFNETPRLKDFYKQITINQDMKGLTFISTMEALNYPFYGVQFHPEKSVYDWYIDVAIDHEDAAVKFTQYLADFFVQEARKSTHRFPDSKSQAAALIDNYTPIFLGYPSYYSLYFFNYTKSEQKVTDLNEWTQSMFIMQTASIGLILTVISALIFLALLRYCCSGPVARSEQFHSLNSDTEKLLIA